MAKVDISYHCGCGFRTADQRLAEEHCDTSYHDLTVTGVIKSSTRTHRSQAKVAGQKEPKPRRTQAESQLTSAHAEEFDKLRKLLRRQ